MTPYGHTRPAKHVSLTVCTGHGTHEVMCYAAKDCPLCAALARIQALLTGREGQRQASESLGVPAQTRQVALPGRIGGGTS
jgi:hypothetical protein